MQEEDAHLTRQDGYTLALKSNYPSLALEEDSNISYYYHKTSKCFTCAEGQSSNSTSRGVFKRYNLLVQFQVMHMDLSISTTDGNNIQSRG